MMSKFLQWSINNKLVVFLILTTTCLFISTVVLSSRTRPASACSIQSGSSYFKKITNNNEDESITNKSAYYRLPRNTIPKSYKLFLRPDMRKKKFNGVVWISLRVTKPTRSITLHSNQLNITSTTLRNNHNNEIKIDSVVTVPGKREFLIVNAGTEITKGTYELNIHFMGRLDRGFVGFYSSTLKNGRRHFYLFWVNSDGTTSYDGHLSFSVMSLLAIEMY